MSWHWTPHFGSWTFFNLCVYLISDGSEYPWRAKLRGPSFVNLQVLPELLRGYKISDVIAVLGSLDFVVGEVDR